MHSSLYKIKQATLGTKFEGRLWLVGGAVRDELLDRPEPNDFDIVTELSSGELAALLDPLSESKPVTYARFGTALVRIDGTSVELATARKESYAPESRKPEVEPATLLEDAQRRDFTVNALMRNLHTGELYDPLGKGLDDLNAKILRTPLDPAATFRDDPLRMLRAVRFRWTLGFEPAPGVYEAVLAERERLGIISGERIRDELVKMLKLPDADKALEDLRATGLLRVFAPELDAMKGVTQGSFHHLDVWDHSLLVVRTAGSGDLGLTLAALLHDVGKPPTRSIDERGDIRFFGHERVGAKLAKDILDRLRFSSDEIEPVVKLVRNHMRLQTTPELSPAAARRLMRDLGPDLDRLLALVEADANSLKPGVKAMDVPAIRLRMEEVRAMTPVETLESPLSGGEIMALLRIEEGPKIGEAKGFLLEKVLDGDVPPKSKVAAAQALLARADLGTSPVDQILRAIGGRKPAEPFLIAISGSSGAGKSTLAIMLNERLPNSAIVESDVFWNPDEDRRGDDWPAVERQRLLQEVILPAKRGEPVRYRPFDWERGVVGDEVEAVNPSFLILEGIALFHPVLAEHFDLKVWIDAPMDEAHAEGIRRDRVEQGVDHESKWKEVWSPNDRAFYEKFRPMEEADLVVPWFKA